MKRSKNPDVDLKLKYRKILELALIVSLTMHISLFLARPEIQATQKEVKSEPLQIEVEDIPVTEQVKLPPAPIRPSVPVPTESEAVPEDITIETTELDWNLTTLPPPPPPSEGDDIEEEYVFVPYDEPPFPIGGYAAMQANLRYPDLARKAGIEARVIVGVLVDEKGNSIKTQVLKSSGSPLRFDEAACDALLTVKWKPAVQRDRPVKVWVSVPVVFKLTNTQKVGT
jgi:protein TonB